MALPDPPHGAFFRGPMEAGMWMASLSAEDACVLANILCDRAKSASVPELTEWLMALKYGKRYELIILINAIRNDPRIINDSVSQSLLTGLIFEDE